MNETQMQTLESSTNAQQNIAAGLPPAYYMLGQHGGFFIADRHTLHAAIALLEQAVAQYPDVHYNMDLEAYTLDRLVRGAQLGVEQVLAELPEIWRLHLTGSARGRRTAEAAHGSGSGLRLTAARAETAMAYQAFEVEMLNGAPLNFGAWVRCQSGTAVLGIEAMGATGPIENSLHEVQAQADGAWHYLEISGYAIPAGASKVVPHLRIEAGAPENIADFAEAACHCGGVQVLGNPAFECGQELADAETVARLRRLARSGRLSLISSYTQPMLFALDEESAVRQFAWAQQITRDVIGEPMRGFATQEPCWTGQMPALLQGSGIPAAAYANSWAMCGLCPRRSGERFDWVGPDGTRLPVVTIGPHARNRAEGLWGRWSPGAPPSLKAQIEARAAQIEHPFYMNLGWDFLPDRVYSPYTAIEPEVDVRFTNLPDYMAAARHEGDWPDAYRDFTPRVCWGLWGGDFYRDSREAAATAMIAERMHALFGIGADEEVRRIWELALLSEHHDPWLCVPSVFGVWMGSYPHYHETRPPEPTYWGAWPGPFPTFADFIRECRVEAQARTAELAGPVADQKLTTEFHVINLDQTARCEWTSIDVALPVRSEVRADGEAWQVVNERGNPVAAHLCEEAGRLRGAILAQVPGFSSTGYRLQRCAAGEVTHEEISIIQTDQGIEIANATLRLCASTSNISLERASQVHVRGLKLEARVNDVPAVAVFNTASHARELDGSATVTLSGRLANIPVSLQLRLAPYSPQLDVLVTADLHGERMEGTEQFEFCGKMWRDHTDFSGSLRLKIEFPEQPEYLAHLPFELRKPSRPEYWSVDYHLSEWHGGAVCTLLDRTTGILHDADSIGVILCHSGEYPLTDNTIWPHGFGTALVHGRKQYRIGLRPYDPADRHAVLLAAQQSRTPLELWNGSTPANLLAGLHIEGEVLVSGLAREGSDWTLRLWNPGAITRARIALAGHRFTPCNLLDEPTGETHANAIEVQLDRMQLATLRIEAGA